MESGVRRFANSFSHFAAPGSANHLSTGCVQVRKAIPILRLIMNRKKRQNDTHGQPGEEGSAFPQKSYRGNRKALQLCRQVQKTLNYALGGLEDDVLAGLYVESVEPAPNDKHLMVTVSPLDPETSPEEVLLRLGRFSGRLRSEIAADIHRKRVPELSFHCIPPRTAGSS